MWGNSSVLVTGGAGLTGSSSKIVHRPLPTDVPNKQCKPAISKAKGLFDWRLTVPLPEGLTRTIAGFEPARGLFAVADEAPVSCGY
jgi:nucleoside-diphosphate-sugar epimerase